ncbi:hypothetical protein QBC36DRAFT_291413 [Triangularia setosa]|uniref:Uncharacterized protein n=1 Tax=Triangularia setosa TaxID=2587417 RepID=A0AAN6W5T3_9PEZI|nr:hypothetical protein QBC36DRAFT_291413 [Podospora setosa]
MAAPNPPLATNARKNMKKMSNSRSSSPSPEPTLFSVDTSRRPSSSCASPGLQSPPSAPPVLPPRCTIYSLTHLAPEEIGWNWQTNSLGWSTIASSSTTPASYDTPRERYLTIPQRHEMIAIGITTRSPTAFTYFSPNSQERPAVRKQQPQAGDSRQDHRLLTSLAEGWTPGSPSRPQELELFPSMSNSESTVCSTARAMIDNAGDDDLKLDTEAMRLKLAELNRKRSRGKPRAFKKARMKKRDSRKKSRQVEGSKAEVESQDVTRQPPAAWTTTSLREINI